MFSNDLGNDNFISAEDKMSTQRGSGYGFEGLPKLTNGNNGSGTKSQASTASSSATRDSGISLTDAQRAADEQRCKHDIYITINVSYILFFLNYMKINEK